MWSLKIVQFSFRNLNSWTQMTLWFKRAINWSFILSLRRHGNILTWLWLDYVLLIQLCETHLTSLRIFNDFGKVPKSSDMIYNHSSTQPSHHGHSSKVIDPSSKLPLFQKCTSATCNSRNLHPFLPTASTHLHVFPHS